MFPLHLRLWVSPKTSLPQKEVQNLLWFDTLGEGRGWRSTKLEVQIMDLLLNWTINKWSLLRPGKARCHLQTTLFQAADAIPGSATCQPCDPRKVTAHPYLFCCYSVLKSAVWRTACTTEKKQPYTLGLHLDQCLWNVASPSSGGQQHWGLKCCWLSNSLQGL